VNSFKKDFLQGSQNKKEMECLFNQLEKVLLTWTSEWTNFFSAPVLEEASKRLKLLDDIQFYTDGGYPNAERKRIYLARGSAEMGFFKPPSTIQVINIQGNFLFDRAQSKDFKNVLLNLGLSCEELGDIWLIKDRGAQVLCTSNAAQQVNRKSGLIRSVEITCEALEITQLNIPLQKVSKLIKTVEASTRLDAITSAGFGISRAKAVALIKNGAIRLNWNSIKQASRLLKTGDRIQLDRKGNLEILSMELTKKERWRIDLLRH